MSLHGKTMELTLTQYTEGKKEKQLCCFQQRAKIHWNKTIPCQLLVKLQPLLECSLPYVDTQTGISAYSISKQEQNSISLLWNTSSLQTEIALKTFTKCCFWLTWLRGLARVRNICEHVLGKKIPFGNIVFRKKQSKTKENSSHPVMTIFYQAIHVNMIRKNEWVPRYPNKAVFWGALIHLPCSFTPHSESLSCSAFPHY